MTSESTKILRDYLEGHEKDIAWGFDDFGELRKVFIELMEREPNKDG